MMKCVKNRKTGFEYGFDFVKREIQKRGEETLKSFSQTGF